MILLPLKSDLGDISRVLGCLCTYGAIGRAPRRFELLNQEVTPLLGDARIREGIETAPDDEEDDDEALPQVLSAGEGCGAPQPPDGPGGGGGAGGNSGAGGRE